MYHGVSNFITSGMHQRYLWSSLILQVEVKQDFVIMVFLIFVQINISSMYKTPKTALIDDELRAVVSVKAS